MPVKKPVPMSQKPKAVAKPKPEPPNKTAKKAPKKKRAAHKIDVIELTVTGVVTQKYKFSVPKGSPTIQLHSEAVKKFEDQHRWRFDGTKEVQVIKTENRGSITSEFVKGDKIYAVKEASYCNEQQICEYTVESVEKSHVTKDHHWEKDQDYLMVHTTSGDKFKRFPEDAGCKHTSTCFASVDELLADLKNRVRRK